MSSQQNISLIKRLYDEAYNKKSLSTFDEVFSKDVQFNDSATHAHKNGLNVIKELEKTYEHAFPSKKTKIEDIFATEDKVVVRWTCTGVHKGDLQGIAATNKECKISGISIYKFSNGKVTEVWQSWDRLALLEQVGEIQKDHALHY